jgi:outer membrane protein assembly factor BamB
VEVVDGRAYFASGYGVVYCLDAATGRTVWKVDTVKTFGNRPSNYGYNPTPLVAEGKVVFSMTEARAQTVALDARTGRTLWAAAPADWTVSDASPILIRRAERSVVVETFHEATVGRDLADGKVLWQHRPGGHTQLTPVYADDKLLVRSGDGTALLDLADDGTGVQTVWNGPRIHDVSQAVILARTVFVITQPIRRHAVIRAESEGSTLELAGRQRLWFLQAWDLATGTVCRSRRVYSGGAIWAADGRVYVLEGGQGPGPDGKLGRTRIRLLEPTAEGFAPRGLLHPVRGRRQAWANGAIVEGKMAYRHGDVLGLYDLQPGSSDPGSDADRGDPGAAERPATGK